MADAGKFPVTGAGPRLGADAREIPAGNAGNVARPAFELEICPESDVSGAA